VFTLSLTCAALVCCSSLRVVPQAEGQTGFTVNDREGEPMEPTDSEDDLLDMAFGLEATSR
jgi:hypothetical protein